MRFHLHDDWSEIVKILAPPHVGLGDLISQERGDQGERFVMAKLKSGGYTVANYHSWTQGDIWAINTHSCLGFKVTSIVLAQVKTSARAKYRFSSSERAALTHLVKDVRNRLRRSDGSSSLPILRSTSRVVVSGWLTSVKDTGRYSFDATECIAIAGRWAEGDTTSIQSNVRNAIEKLVWRTLR